MNRGKRNAMKIISGILSVVLLLSAIPMQAFAATEQPSAELEVQQEEILTDETPEENRSIRGRFYD